MHLVILLYALFASVFTIAKTALNFTEPFFLVGSRMVFAGFLLLLYLFLFNIKEFKFEKVNWWRVLRLAAFNIYLTNVFEFWGLKYLTSSKTCFIYSLSPFISALLSYFVFSEKLNIKKVFGLIVGFLGFFPILLNETNSEELTGHLLFLSWAEVAVIIAALCSVYGWILLRQLVKEDGFSPMMANGLSMFLGGLMALGHSAIYENWDPLPVVEYIPFLECAMLLILISNFIAYNLYGHLLKRYTATFMSFAGFLTPLFSGLFGWIFLDEILGWPFFSSAIIVFVGLILFYQEELKSEYRISYQET